MDERPTRIVSLYTFSSLCQLNCCVLFHCAEVRAEFEQTSYSLEEDAGSREICVSLSNLAAVPVKVQVKGEGEMM